MKPSDVQAYNIVVRVVIKMLLCTKVSLQTLIRGVNVKFNYANALRAGNVFFLFNQIDLLGNRVEKNDIIMFYRRI